MEQTGKVQQPTPGRVKGSKKSWFSRRKELEQNLEYVNREIYGRNVELAQTNKTLALLQAIDSLVLGPEEELPSLSTKLAHEVVKAGGFPFVAILGHHTDGHAVVGHGDLETYGWAVTNEIPKRGRTIIQNCKLRGDIAWFTRKESLKFITLGSLSNDQIAFYTGDSQETAIDLREHTGITSACFIKLIARQTLVGVMVVGFTDENRTELSKFERTLFVRLGEAVGIALDHKMLLDENQRVVGQLERSNRRLKMLDRTKDDFISMASHQLRTPLTSVKGYVSMVLDGDAGKISPLQRKLLNQSFVSSQRMAYLISDLLNVSRLRTGKFIIEPTAIDLSRVIEEELSQLIETAKGRNLQLKFHKPKQFPTLPMDETKMRQVIMNFVDNAMYYTPAGGHIDVYLRDKPDSIEFTVVDDGIGVPRHEQHHLFSKFYRAHNAQRARPDGTGLGLFMAKKVVIAQGGAIIFKSREGHGSTFGFTFPKNKLLPRTPSDQN